MHVTYICMSHVTHASEWGARDPLCSNALRHIFKVLCSALQRVAACCSVSQCVEVRCKMLQWEAQDRLCSNAPCRVLQCVAVWCSVLQCGALSCSVLQCVAVCCSVLRRVALLRGVAAC